MGKLACQLSLSALSQLPFPLPGYKGLGQGSQEKRSLLHSHMKPGDPEASCGAQASGGADCGTWYLPCAGRRLRAKHSLVLPIMPPLKQAECRSRIDEVVGAVGAADVASSLAPLLFLATLASRPPFNGGSAVHWLAPASWGLDLAL